MISKELIQLSKEVGRVSVPSYVYDFVVHNPDLPMHKIYQRLLEWIPDGQSKPTLNEAVLYYNLARLQYVADKQLSALKSNTEELSKLLRNPELNEKKIRWYSKNIERLEDRYRDLATDLMKYANAGLDRDTPKNINIQNTTVIGLSEIHDKVREIKNIND